MENRLHCESITVTWCPAICCPAVVHTVRHLNLTPDNTELNVGQILFHSCLQKSLTIAIRKGMSNHGNYWRNNSPPSFWIHRESEISYISGTCSYLGVSGTHQSPSSAYLQESGAGGIQEGLVWLWAIMEMTVCAMKPWQTMPDLTPHPLHSLRYPTGDISGPSIAKVLLQYSGCKGGKEQDHMQRRNLPPPPPLLPPTTLELLADKKNITALANSVKTCGMQLWSREEYICWER